MQRGEKITRRDRKSRENAEGHAYAEPQYLLFQRFRICVRFSGMIFDNHGRKLRGVGLMYAGKKPLIRLPAPSSSNDGKRKQAATFPLHQTSSEAPPLAPPEGEVDRSLLRSG